MFINIEKISKEDRYWLHIQLEKVTTYGGAWGKKDYLIPFVLFSVLYITKSYNRVKQNSLVTCININMKICFLLVTLTMFIFILKYKI